MKDFELREAAHDLIDTLGNYSRHLDQVRPWFLDEKPRIKKADFVDWASAVRDRLCAFEAQMDRVESYRVLSLATIDDCEMSLGNYLYRGDPLSAIRQLATYMANSLENVCVVKLDQEPRAYANLKSAHDITHTREEHRKIREDEILTTLSSRWGSYSLDVRLHSKQWKHLIDRQCGVVYSRQIDDTQLAGKTGKLPASDESTLSVEELIEYSNLPDVKERYLSRSRRNDKSKEDDSPNFEFFRAVLTEQKKSGISQREAAKKIGKDFRKREKEAYKIVLSINVWFNRCRAKLRARVNEEKCKSCNPVA